MLIDLLFKLLGGDGVCLSFVSLCVLLIKVTENLLPFHFKKVNIPNYSLQA